MREEKEYRAGPQTAFACCFFKDSPHGRYSNVICRQSALDAKQFMPSRGGNPSGFSTTTQASAKNAFLGHIFLFFCADHGSQGFKDEGGEGGGKKREKKNAKDGRNTITFLPS